MNVHHERILATRNEAGRRVQDRVAGDAERSRKRDAFGGCKRERGERCIEVRQLLDALFGTFEELRRLLWRRRDEDERFIQPNRTCETRGQIQIAKLDALCLAAERRSKERNRSVVGNSQKQTLRIG